MTFSFHNVPSDRWLKAFGHTDATGRAGEARGGGPKRASGKRLWPRVSEAAAVHSSQIPEAIEAARKCGVPIEFTKTGEPVFTSMKHETEYLRKVRGMVNRTGCGKVHPE